MLAQSCNQSSSLSHSISSPPTPLMRSGAFTSSNHRRSFLLLSPASSQPVSRWVVPTNSSMRSSITSWLLLRRILRLQEEAALVALLRTKKIQMQSQPIKPPEITTTRCGSFLKKTKSKSITAGWAATAPPRPGNNYRCRHQQSGNNKSATSTRSSNNRRGHSTVSESRLLAVSVPTKMLLIIRKIRLILLNSNSCRQQEQ